MTKSRLKEGQIFMIHQPVGLLTYAILFENERELLYLTDRAVHYKFSKLATVVKFGSVGITVTSFQIEESLPRALYFVHTVVLIISVIDG